MREKFPWAKFVAGYILYVFFHEIDRLMPGIIGTIFGEGIESVYAHMKMLFYAYLLLSLFDFLRFRKTALPKSFFYSRMLILASVPWMMIAMYYAVEALGVVTPHAVELAWGLVMTALGLYFSIRLEEPFDVMELRPALKSMIVFAFVTALVTYIGFSFHIPDNFFIAPG